MDFDFSAEQKELQHQARRMLSQCCDLRLVRRVLDGDAAAAQALWRQVAALGWLGAAIPEAHGGLGLGGATLALVAQELGRALAPLPVSSSLYLAAPCMLHGGDEAQRDEWLPPLASGECIATLAAAEGLVGIGELEHHATREVGGALHGIKLPVPDGLAAHWAVVTAQGSAGAGLYVVDLQDPGVRREALASVDATRPMARIVFDAAPARRLRGALPAAQVLQRALDEAAVWFAFEQIGGAEAALALGCDYARVRHAFGRPIGSFQAIKHKLADMYVRNQLAFANACHGAWAIDASPDALPAAAAAARVAACEAFEFAAKETIQVHGGIGATWEADPHLFYRRARVLQAAVGAPAVWRERLVQQLEAQLPVLG